MAISEDMYNLVEEVSDGVEGSKYRLKLAIENIEKQLADMKDAQRRGGSSRSEAKAAAARRNGSLYGGRPKKNNG